MIAYILKSTLLLVILFMVYKFWLENEKTHRFNRFYLLSSLIFGLLIPLQLFTFETKISKAINFQLPEIVLNNNSQSLSSISTNNQIVLNTILILYTTIALLLSIRFVLNLHSFHKKIKANKSQIINDQKVVLLQDSILPHSFLNTIFLNENDFKNDLIDPQLITHETAHIEQKHSLDIIFIELIQILFWFNPIIFFYKKAIKLNHEFLADEAVITQTDSVSYYQNLLLKMASNQSHVALASSINFQITKKRLLMMTKKESRFKAILKTSAAVFIFTTLFFAFSTETTIAQGSNRKAINEPPTFYKEATENTKQPEFPGGITEFYKFIGKNFKIPEKASKSKVYGKVKIEFFVEKDGSLSDYKIIQDLGFGLGNEIIRVLKLSPKWKPGTVNNEPARVMYSLPVTIDPSA